MPVNKIIAPTITQASTIYHLPLGTLRAMRQRGCDIFDAREVVAMLSKTTRKPDEWKGFFEDNDDSHEHWKKAKTKEEVERLRLINSKASGEMFDKSDGERIQEAWASALQLALMERQATAPQMLAGKDEAWIADWIEEENRKILEQLSDLESGLWEQVYDNYAQDESSPTDEETGGKPKAQAQADGQRMVRAKRKSGSGSDTEA